MPGESLPFLLAFAGVIGFVDTLIPYSAYLSISVWRGLAVPIFRSRALWMALLGIPFAAAITFNFLGVLILPSGSALVPVVSDAIFTIFLVALVVWIDRTVGTVIRLDYLRRDLLSWKRFRVVYYACVVVGNAIFASQFAYGSAFSITGVLVIVAALTYGLLCLVKGARTTKDMTFRSHIRWFGFLIAVLVPVLVTYGVLGVSVIGFPFLAAVAYCFYKMTRFLIPTSKFAPADATHP